MKRLASVAEFQAWQASLAAARDTSRPRLRVCDGTGCRALGSQKLLASLRAELDKRGAAGQVDVVATGCPGFCECGPLVTADPARTAYVRVKPNDAAAIVNQALSGGPAIDRLLFAAPDTGERIQAEPDLPFYKLQQRRILDLNGQVDPARLDDYVALGGYAALARVLAGPTPEQVIAEIKASGLRGRGGAGFPTGVKWDTCRQNVLAAGQGYVVCNADEGDPGAFMDRSVTEGNPHRVIEGMLIGAYAVGAREGYVYIRHEYPLAVENLRLAVAQAREAGLLGEAILGTAFSCDIYVQEGAGAFVCGEETALMASIEGRIGEPRSRPPYPAVSGLWGKPTNINNVKTWASVPLILSRGAEWYASLGTAKSKGTTVFSLVGKVNNTGLVEVPLGMPLRQLVDEIGGGVRDGRPLKAIQTGGPSGGCIPASLLDLTVDYESLAQAGSMMGSGGMIVMDDTTCMVDMARYFLNFTRFESCGKCTACREGIERMYAILDAITRGEGQEGDLERLEALGQAVKDASLCGLGRSAPNPVLTTLRYFRDEYEAHIRDKACPAGVCKALIMYYIIPEKCPGCSLCWKACPEGAVTGTKGQAAVINSATCIRCGICRDVCNLDAVAVKVR